MKIQQIVEKALQDGYLTPVMEAEIGQICQMVAELSVEEYAALERLMNALLEGKVATAQRKQFCNVMEELVLGEALMRIAEIDVISDRFLDVGDITAYALNRLPPLYATTEEGANYQRQRAREELQALIRQRVSEAIAHHLDRLDTFPERPALKAVSGDEVVKQIASLLQTYAVDYERGSEP